MKILVLGAGVIGVTTAYYLAKLGAEVTVVDRQPGPALETSYANAGQISPGYATPWAAPGVPVKAVKWLLQHHSPLAVGFDGSMFQLQWIWQMLQNCNLSSYNANKARMVRLAEYSRDCLRLLRRDSGISYEERSAGTLQIFRKPAQYEAAGRDIKVLQDAGVPYELLEAAQLAQAEPALANRNDLCGGLRLPNDETGDCYLFTTRLVQLAQELDVQFQFSTRIEALSIEGQRIAGVMANNSVLTADAYVLALGSYSRKLTANLGLALPVYPVKGYSITLPILNAERAPVSTVLDETYKVAVTRFAQRIRVGGMAELAGFNLQLKPARKETLSYVVNDLFPGAGDNANASFWTGLRPMTPDGTPIVGGSEYKNLFINTGHGTLGWTMACGSGRVIADIIQGRKPEIEIQDLNLSRYS